MHAAIFYHLICTCFLDYTVKGLQHLYGLCPQIVPLYPQDSVTYPVPLTGASSPSLNLSYITYGFYKSF